jgi:pimeloyl-ACP methyl ester carboxylesterase
MKIKANHIDIEVEDSATDDVSHAQRPVVLMVMGLGMQLVTWPPAMVQALHDAGFRTIRMDNRDIGLSQSFDHAGKPHLLWESLKFRVGLPNKPAYTLQDMAMDALGVLDACRVPRAHVVGVSMGGMVAQRIALAAPQRIITLTSIMSSSGARGLPAAHPKVVRALLSRPANNTQDAVVEHYIQLFKIIGSPAFPPDEALLRERIRLGIARSWRPQGTQRQMVAIAADRTRAQALLLLGLPTLVIHGKADPLVPIACGRDTARRIPGAQFVGIEGMGHDLPPGVVARVLQELLPFMKDPRA